MRRTLLLLAVLLASWGLVVPQGVSAAPRHVAKAPLAEGTGGAAATVDPHATRAAIDILTRGGNAVDAAVAAAAVLNVTQPYSGGIGGGGFMLVYLADEGRVVTIDSRETAPAVFPEDVFVEDGTVIPFAERVTSGLGVGVPGTVAGWEHALAEHGTMTLARVLQPAVTIAQRGWRVDETYHAQTAANAARFRQFTSTSETFLVDGEAPPVGATVRNRDLADTLRLLQRRGAAAFYSGALSREIVASVTEPPLAADATFTVRPGLMTEADLAAYTSVERPPTHVPYRGLDVYGMGPPSSGGSTVGETLRILDGFPLGGLDATARAHHFLEASKLAFADRNAYLADSDFVDVPLAGLLSEGFAAERRALLDPASAAPAPVPPGDPWPYDGGGGAVATSGATAAAGGSTTHLTVSDAAGNVVSYTFTIEQIGGSGITVPGRGFLLNNELTDFNPSGDSPNLPAGGKRPRSSMSPTIVLDGGEPWLALGSPGGATIITTVAQILLGRVDGGLTLPEALAAPRAAQLNGPNTTAEPAFVERHGPALTALGHAFAQTGEIGAATAIEFLGGGRVQAVAEPVRRGGGSAQVQRPDR